MSRYETWSDAETVKAHLVAAGFEIHARALKRGAEPSWNGRGEVLLLLPENELVKARSILPSIEADHLERDSAVPDLQDLFDCLELVTDDDDIDLYMDGDKWSERYWLFSMLIRIIRIVY